MTSPTEPPAVTQSVVGTIDVKASESPKGLDNQVAGPSAGTLADFLGTGPHAQISIVYLVIRYCFFAAGAITAAVLLTTWLGHGELKWENIEIVWSMFIPVITGAMGYVFGKGRE